jgi:hypothetical protein
MKLTMSSLWASIVLATGVLALGYGLVGWWLGAILVVAAGVIWGIGVWRRWKWTAYLSFIFPIGAAAVGYWLGMRHLFMLFGVCASLAAWDLDRFQWRFRSLKHDEAIMAMEKVHIYRLSLVIGAGLLVSVVGLQVNVKPAFGIVLVTSMLMIIALNRALSLFRRKKKKG